MILLCYTYPVMIVKGLTLLLLGGAALLLSGCSLSSPFGRAEAPLIIVSPAPPQNASLPTPESETASENISPSDVLGTVEEGTPSTRPPADEASPVEIATSTALLKVPTPTPTPTPPPEKPKLEIRASSIKLAEDGQKYLIEGQLYNRGKTSADLTNFKLVAHLYDRRGQLLTSSVGYPSRTRLSPQASTSFRLAADYVADVDTYKVQGGY